MKFVEFTDTIGEPVSVKPDEVISIRSVMSAGSRCTMVYFNNSNANAMLVEDYHFVKETIEALNREQK